MKRIDNDQRAYELGYANPSTPAKDYYFQQVVVAFAFLCGQSDYQNSYPKADLYRREDYEWPTAQRNAD